MPDPGRPLPLTADPAFRFCPRCAAELPGPRPVRCASCGAEHWRNAKPCAGALVTDASGRLLLVQRALTPWHGHWDIPGGFCEPDELPADAAVREVREETGLQVVVADLVGMWIDRYGDGDDADLTLNCYFTAHVVGATTPVVDPRESLDARWFPPGGLPGRIAFPDHARDVLETWRSRSVPTD